MGHGYLKASFYDGKKYTLSGKQAVLLVSVGVNYHEAEWLTGTIALINQSNFSRCTIAVADTLQRHNIVSNDQESAYNIALRLGNEWLSRNDQILSQLNCEVKILRWDEVLTHPTYSYLKQKIENEYHENAFYKEMIDSTINTFLARIKKRNPSIDLENIFSNSLQYLIEECPVIMPLWASQGYDFVIYPKVMTKAMATTYELFVKPFYPGKCQWLALEFKRLSNQPIPTVNPYFAALS